MQHVRRPCLTHTSDAALLEYLQAASAKKSDTIKASDVNATMATTSPTISPVTAVKECYDNNQFVLFSTIAWGIIR